MKKQLLPCTISLALLTALVIAFTTAAKQSEISSAHENTSPIASAPKAVTNTITQYGVTWTFDKDYEYGQFANGDYWVLGPITITSITPEPVNINGEDWVNGWQINPMPDEDQSLDWRAARHTPPDSTSLTNIEGGSSVLKVVSREPYTQTDSRPMIQLAVVLTVVEEIPPDRGASVFRPPYVGNDRVYYSAANIKANLLPLYPKPDDAGSLDGLYEQLRHVQMDHTRYSNQYLRPMDALPFYAAAVNSRNAEAILRLFSDYTVEEKMPLLIAMMQTGIDYYHFLLNGNVWVGNGSGEQPGNFLPIVLTAYLLDNAEMIALIKEESPDGYEELTCYFNKDGLALWGHSHLPFEHYEKVYWDKLLDHQAPGSSTLRDPYGYIDGGYEPGSGYQYCCTSLPFKGTALILHTLPELQKIWNPVAMLEYADRWVYFGTWTQPDPCAPATEEGVYSVDYGPDGEGGCILDKNPLDGIGRFPQSHGTQANQGHYGNKYVNAMWNAHRYKRMLMLRAIPAEQSIYLTWEIYASLSPTSTWRIEYYNRTDTSTTIATDSLPNTVNNYILANLTNYELYTITLSTVGTTPALSDTVRVLVTDKLIYSPFVEH